VAKKKAGNQVNVPKSSLPMIGENTLRSGEAKSDPSDKQYICCPETPLH
jgi:hypothetical protein